VAHPDGDAVAEQAIRGNLEHFRFYSNHEDALSLRFTQFLTQNRCAALPELLLPAITPALSSK
jgi:hypothetical protein